jgi:hypothetical protein
VDVELAVEFVAVAVDCDCACGAAVAWATKPTEHATKIANLLENDGLDFLTGNSPLFTHDWLILAGFTGRKARLVFSRGV